MKNETKATPAFDALLNHIRVCVWQNSANGKLWLNTVINRRFKDGDEWKDSNTFSGLGDLALVAEAVKLAQEFIRSKELGSTTQTDTDDIHI